MRPLPDSFYTRGESGLAPDFTDGTWTHIGSYWSICPKTGHPRLIWVYRNEDTGEHYELSRIDPDDPKQPDG